MTINQAAALTDEFGADHAFVVIDVGSKIPMGKKLGQGFLLALTPGEVAHGGNVTVSAGVNFEQFSGTAIKVAMVDCKSGEVLWSDSDHVKNSLNEDRVEGMAKDILKRLL